MARALLSVAILMGFSTLAQAGECKMEGLHLCCGGCVKAVEAALKDAEGITGLKIDQEAKTVVFAAETRKQANQAMAKVRRAGYFGKGTFDGKEMKAPASKIEEGAKSDAVSVTQTHLCCGACVKAVEAALKKVAGVTEVSSDQGKGSVALKGTAISLAAVEEALHKAGFHGTVK